MTAGLYLVGKGDWMMAIFVYVMGVIGFSGANIFYDSLLPSVADESKVDSVSSLGFAMGYLGGGLLFLLNVVMTLQPAIFGLADAGEAVRWSFVSVALWWGAFTIITITWVPEPEIRKKERQKSSIAEGFKQLHRTFQEIRHLKTVLLFLLVQFVGFPAALIFGRLGERWGVRPSIFLAIGVYIAVTIWGTMMREKYEFYVLAVVIGLVQGGIQALSRSYYSRLIPKNQAAEYYGFYNMLGKFAAIIGPALMGVVGLIMRNVLMPESPSAEQISKVGQDAARWSIASLIVLFVIGAVLLFYVDEEKGRAEAEYLNKN